MEAVNADNPSKTFRVKGRQSHNKGNDVFKAGGVNLGMDTSRKGGAQKGNKIKMLMEKRNSKMLDEDYLGLILAKFRKYTCNK